MLLSNFRSRELWYTKFVRNDIVWSSFLSTISDWFVTWKYLSIFCSFWNLNVKVAANANFWIWQHFRFESEMFIARKRRYQLQHAILGSHTMFPDDMGITALITAYLHFLWIHPMTSSLSMFWGGFAVRGVLPVLHCVLRFKWILWRQFTGRGCAVWSYH